MAHLVAVYACAHFVVDFACVATVLGKATPVLGVQDIQAATLAVVAYDLFAFCLQLPLGALLDVWGRRASPRAALVAFALVAAGVCAGMSTAVSGAVASVLLVAVGNALFHCVGGVEVLGESAGRAAPSGVFISTGAIGVFLGSVASVNTWPHLGWLLLAMLAACASVEVLRAPTHRQPASVGPRPLVGNLTREGWLAVGMLAATVALRSYTGMIMAFPWKAQLPLAAGVLAAVVAGKAVGGFVADRVGMRVAGALSLGGAALLFLPSMTSAPAGLAATFLFNFTMAITLSALALLLPRAQGLAFGIASFSLVVGALPALMGVRATSGTALAVCSLVSLVLLEWGLTMVERTSRRSTQEGQGRMQKPQAEETRKGEACTREVRP